MLPSELRQLIFDYLPLPTIWRYCYQGNCPGWLHRGLVRYDDKNFVEGQLVDGPSGPISGYNEIITMTIHYESGSDLEMANLEVDQILQSVVQRLETEAKGLMTGPSQYFKPEADDKTYHGTSTDVLIVTHSQEEAALRIRQYVMATTTDHVDPLWQVVIRILQTVWFDREFKNSQRPPDMIARIIESFFQDKNNDVRITRLMLI